MKNKESNNQSQFLTHIGNAIKKDFYLHKKTKGLTVKYVCDHYHISAQVGFTDCLRKKYLPRMKLPYLASCTKSTIWV